MSSVQQIGFTDIITSNYSWLKQKTWLLTKVTSSNINYEIFINLIILFEIWYIVQNRSLWRNTSNCSISLCYNQIISLYIMFIRPSVYTEIFVAILRRTDGQQFNHQFASNFMIYDLLSDKLLLSRKNNIKFYF